MTDPRRPAAASRVLALGLSTAATLGLTAAMAMAQAPVEQTLQAAPIAVTTPAPSETAGAAPRKVVVIVRRHHVTGTTPVAAPPTARARPTATAPPPRAVPAPPAARPRPVTRTRGS